MIPLFSSRFRSPPSSSSSCSSVSRCLLPRSSSTTPTHTPYSPSESIKHAVRRCRCKVWGSCSKRSPTRRPINPSLLPLYRSVSFLLLLQKQLLSRGSGHFQEFLPAKLAPFFRLLALTPLSAWPAYCADSFCLTPRFFTDDSQKAWRARTYLPIGQLMDGTSPNRTSPQ